MIAVVVSRADRASEHVGEHLLDLADWTERRDESRPEAAGGGTYHRTADGEFELRTFADLHLHLERPAAAFSADPDLLAFASRHAGETGPLLTAHFTGNFGDADYGGEPGELARAAPNAQRAVLAALDEHAPEGYETGVECTHHGPTDVGAPSMFVELGSGESQWNDPDAARAVARSILAIEGVDPDRRVGGERRHVVGFGGGHYAPRFERIVRETPWAVGHVAADWALAAMDDPTTAEGRAVLDRAFAASGAELAVVDDDRPDLREAIEALGYRVVSEGWLRAVDRVPLALVERLEERLRPVEEGLRFGAPARALGGDGGARTADADEDASADERADVDPVVATLPADLLAEVQGIDAGAARAAVAERALAFETEEGGSRLAGRVALPAPGDREAIVDALLDVLAQRYDEVERRDGTAVAREVAFDPEAAREAGVPEGPAFGRLADGEAVEVDGRTVDPAAVRREREERFPLEPE